MVDTSAVEVVDWHEEFDVVVVGSGAAGYAAALTAAANGAKVAVLDAAASVGGTTAKSGGTTWIPSNHMMELQGLQDDPQAAMAYIARYGFPSEYRADDPHFGLAEEDFALIKRFCEAGREAIDFLVDLGALKFQQRLRPDGTPFPPYPDYQSHLPESRGIIGRSMSPGLPPGIELPPDLLAEHRLLPGGLIMIESMRVKGDELGVAVRLNHRVVDVVADAGGRVRGVVARSGRDTRLIGARSGVVFGSGGFLMNRDLSDEYLKGAVIGGCSAETNTGDFVTIAGRVGARFGHMSQAWWTQTVLELSLRVPSALEAVWYPFGDSMIQVNKYGRRVTNEKQVYNERGQVHFAYDPHRIEFPNALLFQVYDSAVADNPLVWPYRGMTPMPGEQSAYVVSGETLQDLADAISKQLNDLRDSIGDVELAPDFVEILGASIARFNEFARVGIDDDFHRGDNPIQVLANGPGRTDSPNPTMAPFRETGPYYCIIMAAGAIDTKGGPRIDTEARVLDVVNQPIPGLFGAGNCIASPFGQAYPGAGASIGAALTFGYLAGRSAATAT